MEVQSSSRNYTLWLDKTNGIGYFEHNIFGDERGGGVWLEHYDAETGEPSDKLHLMDFDGMYFLPEEVINLLLDQDVVIPMDFYPDFDLFID
jgi:hypothetical protein